MQHKSETDLKLQGRKGDMKGRWHILNIYSPLNVILCQKILQCKVNLKSLRRFWNRWKNRFNIWYLSKGSAKNRWISNISQLALYTMVLKTVNLWHKLCYPFLNKKFILRQNIYYAIIKSPCSMIILREFWLHRVSLREQFSYSTKILQWSNFWDFSAQEAKH